MCVMLSGNGMLHTVGIYGKIRYYGFPFNGSFLFTAMPKILRKFGNFYRHDLMALESIFLCQCTGKMLLYSNSRGKMFKAIYIYIYVWTFLNVLEICSSANQQK